MRNFIFLCILTLLSSTQIYGQSTYKITDLVQDPIQIEHRPQATGFKEVGDTTFTIYHSKSVDFRIYFVNGSQYHNILNPNPTGVFINGKAFDFYCDVEMGAKQAVSNFLDLYEFEYLQRKYLCLFSFREDCLLKGCWYRCYNLFDVTDLDNVHQYSFSSVFGEAASMGDYNNDGIMDFIRVAPKPIADLPEGVPEEERDLHVIFTAYTLQDNKIKQLKKEGSAYYISAKATDLDISEFEVYEADWFIPLKDTTGNVAPATPYFAPYISFDPKQDFLYDAKGYRVEKNTWALHLETYEDLDGALDFCDELKEDYQIEDLFVMIDQYHRGSIHFLILAGNYHSKDKIQKYQQEIKKIGFGNPKIVNLKKEF